MPGWPCGLLSAGTFLIGEKWVAMHTGDTAEMAVYACAAINHCIEERGLAACAQGRLGYAWLALWLAVGRDIPHR